MEANQIIKILADGKFHSGEALGQILGVSRAAIWKQIGQLEELGLQVSSVRGKGYRLSQPIDLLSMEIIEQHLSSKAANCFPRLDLQSVVGSTNDALKNHGADGKGAMVCLAEMQTAGRGRRGRQWVSPYGSNIYMSLVWEFNEIGGALDGLSLCVGITVAETLRHLGCAGVALKWPNDLLFGGRKLGGILLELEGELTGTTRVVIGIGINVVMNRAQGQEIDQDWVSAQEICDKPISRNQLVAELLNRLAESLPAFEVQGFSGFWERWQALDALIGLPVRLLMGNRVVEGVSQGVSEQGELLILSGEAVSAYRAGEISLRAVR